MFVCFHSYTLQGSLRWNDRHLTTTLTSLPFPPQGDLGLCFDLRTDVLNNLLGVAAESGKMDGNITYVTVRTLPIFNCRYCKVKVYLKLLDTEKKNFEISIVSHNRIGNEIETIEPDLTRFSLS